jgi:hypothetical protein
MLLFCLSFTVINSNSRHYSHEKEQVAPSKEAGPLVTIKHPKHIVWTSKHVQYEQEHKAIVAGHAVWAFEHAQQKQEYKTIVAEHPV